MFSALFNVEFLSQLFQLFLAHYFCFGFAAEFIIYFEFVVIIYRTILSLLRMQYDFCCSKGFSNKMSTGDYMSRVVLQCSFGTWNDSYSGTSI